MDFTLTEREREWVELGRTLAAEFAPRAARWDTESAYPEENHKRLGELGLLGTLMTALTRKDAGAVEVLTTQLRRLDDAVHTDDDDDEHGRTKRSQTLAARPLRRQRVAGAS